MCNRACYPVSNNANAEEFKDVPADFELMPNGKIEPITNRGRAIDDAIAQRRAIATSSAAAPTDARS